MNLDKLKQQLKNIPKPVLVIVGVVALLIVANLFIRRETTAPTNRTSRNVTTRDSGELELPPVEEDQTVTPESIRKTEEFRFDFYSPPELGSLDTAIQGKKQLLKSLPIFIKGFQTSVGIKTDISIYSVDDLPHAIHLEINGINLLQMDEGTPELTAFQESLTEALTRVREAGVDPHQINYIFHNIPEYHERAAYWAQQLGLL